MKHPPSDKDLRKMQLLIKTLPMGATARQNCLIS